MLILLFTLNRRGTSYSKVARNARPSTYIQIVGNYKSVFVPVFITSASVALHIQSYTPVLSCFSTYTFALRDEFPDMWRSIGKVVQPRRTTPRTGYAAPASVPTYSHIRNIYIFRCFDLTQLPELVYCWFSRPTKSAVPNLSQRFDSFPLTVIPSVCTQS